MQVHRDDDATQHIVAVGGSVAPGDADELRGHLYDALRGSGSDVLLDARAVTAFDDAALRALSSARARGKSHQQRVAVIDDRGGPVSTSLHRTGLVFRFPVYPDPSTAAAGLKADRDARAAMDFPLEARWRAVHAAERVRPRVTSSGSGT